MPVNGKPSTSRRFELPALKPINFNLTDGTNIPPPPDSPIEEAAAPAAATKSVPAQTPSLATNGQEKVAHYGNGNGNGNYDGRGRTNNLDNPPLSPASSTRPSSIRRFLSRKSLNANYTNGTNTNDSYEDLTKDGARPASPSSFFNNAGSKKNGSWFKRLGSSNRQSVIYENKPQVQKVSMGPPPPKLPELHQLKAKVPTNESSFAGDDMFKNIK